MVETVLALLMLVFVPGLTLMGAVGVGVALALAAAGASPPGRRLDMVALGSATAGPWTAAGLWRLLVEAGPALVALFGAALTGVVALTGVGGVFGVVPLLAAPALVALLEHVRTGSTTARRAAALLTGFGLAVGLGLAASALPAFGRTPLAAVAAGVGLLGALLAAGGAAVVFGRTLAAEPGDAGSDWGVAAGRTVRAAADGAWILAWGLGLAAGVPATAGAPALVFALGLVFGALVLGIRVGVERWHLSTRLGSAPLLLTLLGLAALVVAQRPG